MTVTPQEPIGRRLVRQLGASAGSLLEFVAVYSRLEYALKRAGRVREDRGRLIVHWEELIVAVEPHFRLGTNSQLLDAANYIAEHPPKKQILRDGQVEWREVLPSGARLSLLLEHIRRIRNNVFHGGKFATDLVAEPARNERLLLAATLVLSEVVRLSREHDPVVHAAFAEDLP